MKNPFAKLRKNRQRETLDWNHMCIIHEILFDYPKATTACGPFRAATEADFQDVLEQSRGVLAELDVDAQSSGIFTIPRKIKEVDLLCDLMETRLIHQRDAIAMRTDLEKKYRLYEKRIEHLLALRQELEREQQALQAEH